MRPFLFQLAARRDLASIWQYTAKHWSSDQAEHYTAEWIFRIEKPGATLTVSLP